MELYKRYRPQTWGELVGQDKAARSLQSAVKHDHVPTAYLFSGPRGCGKTSAALILAKAVNCENPVDGNPCNECDTCRSIDNGSQPGVTYISAAQNSSVDGIRDLVSKARLSMPVNRQVFILDEVHNLQKGFEALLIPLEEKDMPALFIFCTTEIDRVPRTILSRTQQRKFRLVDAETMTSHVRKICDAENIDVDVVSAVKMGRGSVRDTLTAVETLVSQEEFDPSFAREGEYITALSHANATDLLMVVAKIDSDGTDFRDFSEMIFEDLRNMLLACRNVSEELIGPLPVDDPHIFHDGKGILVAMKELGDAITGMSQGMDGRIMLEIASMKIMSTLKKMSR